MKRLFAIIAAMAAMHGMCSMPLGVRIASWDDAGLAANDDGEIVLTGEGDETGDLLLGDGVTLVLTNGVATVWSVEFSGRPKVVLDAIPADGKILNLILPGDCEVAADVVIGGVTRSDYSLVVEGNALYVLRANVFTAAGGFYATFEAALDAAGPSGTVTLLRDHTLRRRADLGDAEITLDLGGRTLVSTNRWAFNVGNASITVCNGAMNLAEYGFYITDGSATFENCEILAEKRIAQIGGSGAVMIAEDAWLETLGEDPVVFAIGGFGGKASVVSRGVLLQNYVSASATTAYDIAGNPNDSYGADFTLDGAGGVCFTTAADSCIHHPAGQNGSVEISAGWFSIAPLREFLAAHRRVLPEALTGLDLLEGWDGWRVLFSGFFIRIR